ncbi:autophagy-related protein 22-like protein [Gorgonomyces haynaldii]|nr:autophagy-related protein 22-like protein [Gorgonomyces haynaldii]
MGQPTIGNYFLGVNGPRKYKGDEPTSDLELKGWYSFGVAMEGFSVLGIGIYFPLVLEYLASTVAVDAQDHLKPCSVETDNCVVRFGFAYVPTTSVFFYATTLSVFCQFLLFVSLSSLADHGNYRKQLLLGFAYLTCFLGVFIVFVTKPKHWWFAYFVYIFSNISFGAAFVFFYSYTPILIRNHPLVLQEENGQAYQQVYDKIGNEISGNQFRYGYFAAVIQLLIATAFALLFGDGQEYGLPSYYGLQIGIAFSCVWGFYVMYKYTRPLLLERPGPPLPQEDHFAVYSFKRLYQTLSNASKLPELFKFLIAWFIYSDGFGTIGTAAILFAQTELNANQTLLLGAGIIVPLAAGVGNYFWNWLQLKIQWTTKSILLLQMGCYILFPIYSVLYLKHANQILGLAFYHGFLLGATQSSCRVLFSDLVPPGLEAEFFGLYEITDKGSAWIGPLAMGLIRNWTGSLRSSLWFLVVFLGLPVPFILFLDPKRGKQQAISFVSKQVNVIQSVPLEPVEIELQ